VEVPPVNSASVEELQNDVSRLPLAGVDPEFEENVLKWRAELQNSLVVRYLKQSQILADN